jgi:hypothetical protein
MDTDPEGGNCSVCKTHWDIFQHLTPCLWKQHLYNK